MNGNATPNVPRNGPQPLVTGLDDIARLASERHDAFEVMQYLLQADDDIDDLALDALVDTLAAPIIAAIDCTACANCCRTLDVYLIPEDIPLLAAATETSPTATIDHMCDLQRAQEQDEWAVFRSKPCTFLKGKLCSIYPQRPQSCRMYPVFTPDFRWTLADTLSGAALCPIIYNVLERVEALTDDLSSGRLTLTPHPTNSSEQVSGEKTPADPLDEE